MAEEKYQYEVVVRRLITEYPTLTTEKRYWHIVIRYADLMPIDFDIPEEEYSPEKEDEIAQKLIKEELQRLGREK